MRIQCARACRQRPLTLRSSRIGQVRNYHAAVLGAGITGLTSAWQLAQDPQCHQITILEKSNRGGGWIESETIRANGGEAVFEYGPRSLRSTLPASLPLLYLATNLGLYNDLMFIPNHDHVAKRRYIYYPDRLVELRPFINNPGPRIDVLVAIFKHFQNPLFKGLYRGILKDFFSPPRPLSERTKDESVADFATRRLNRDLAENLVCPLIHGIYAGDIDKLSAQMLFGEYRSVEEKLDGIGGYFSGGLAAKMLHRDTRGIRSCKMDDLMAVDAISAGPELVKHQHSLEDFVKQSRMFTFKRGIGQLIEGLIVALKASSKVTIHDNTEIKSLGKTVNSSSISIEYLSSSTGKKETKWQEFDHVISTIPPVSLAKTMRPNEDARKPKYLDPLLTPALLENQNYAVTAMVVNLYYSNPRVLPVSGFGYLIPRSIPFSQNPECALGTIFASSSSVGQSPKNMPVSQDTSGTKLTVMLGGHYWDGRTEYPDHDTAVEMARSVLKRHLGITAEPACARTRLQKDAIPQYTVGHLDRMKDLSKAVRAEYDNRLVLAGNWYTGVSVGDCVRQGILSATHGIGRGELGGNPGPWRPWLDYDCQNWELKGGVVTSPVRFVDMCF